MKLVREWGAVLSGRVGIDRLKAGVPRSFQEPSVLSLYYKRRYCIEMGGGGVGGCNNVMWSALD